MIEDLLSILSMFLFVALCFVVIGGLVLIALGIAKVGVGV